MGFLIAFSYIYAILPLFVFLYPLPLSSPPSVPLPTYIIFFTYVAGGKGCSLNISVERTTKSRKSLEAGSVIEWWNTCPVYARQFLDEAEFMLEAKKQKNISRM